MSQPALAQKGSTPSTSVNLATDLKPPGEAAAAVKTKKPPGTNACFSPTAMIRRRTVRVWLISIGVV
ncbi:MAG: hypothetical protein L6R41_000411 [Letrouitia leprolyta]|nr:MAG: hypothetical protein L6R41_000411 [Letrouitia leprolyta]